MAQSFFLVASHKTTIMKTQLTMEAQQTLDAVRAFKTGPSQQPFTIKKYVKDKGMLKMTLWNTSASTSHQGALTCEVCLTTVKVDLNEGTESFTGKLHELIDSPFNEADSKLLVDQLDRIPQEVGPEVKELVGEICESLVPTMTVKAIPSQR